MKEIKEIRKQIEEVHSNLGGSGVHQYTIDLVEEIHDELMTQEADEISLTDETCLGSIAYKIDNLLEIAKEDTEDYLIYKQLQTIIEEGRK